jgi:3-oxoacyl-[acyl-carrier protein] reductase
MTCLLNLASPQSISDTVETVIRRWGRIDILVNNAIEWGHVIERGPRAHARRIEELSDDEWIPALRHNVEGPYAAIREVLPHMQKQSWGRIVSVSALFAADGGPGFAWYATAKAAIHGLTRSVFREAGPSGILVNAVMPGFTLTETAQQFVPKAAQANALATSPIQRLLTPEEVGRTIVFLCSAANTAVTGEIIRISGGA